MGATGTRMMVPTATPRTYPIARRDDRPPSASGDPASVELRLRQKKSIDGGGRQLLVASE